MTAPWIAAFVLLWITVLFVLFLQLGQFRRVSDVLERAGRQLSRSVQGLAGHGLPPGSLVPDFQTLDARGAGTASAAALGQNVIYLFLSSDCDPCRALADDLQREGPLGYEIRLVAIIDESERQALRIPEHVLTVYQRDNAVSRAFDTVTTPHAFAVDENGVVVDQGMVSTVTQLRRLAETLRGEADARDTRTPAAERSPDTPWPETRRAKR
jgi:hypothetical protein